MNVLSGTTSVNGPLIAMNLSIFNNTGLTIDHYIVSWNVYSFNPTTLWPCSSNSRNIGIPESYPFSIKFRVQAGEMDNPVLYVYVRVIGFSQYDIPLVYEDKIVGPMTTGSLQDTWTVDVTVN